MKLVRTLVAVVFVVALGLTLALTVLLTDDTPAIPALPPGDFPSIAVAAAENGRLVVLDTSTGEVLRTLDRYSDLREERPEGGYFFPIQVAVTTEGDSAYIEFCCEPAGGYIEKVGINGKGKPIPVAAGYGPSIAPHSRRIAYGVYNFGIEVPVGDRRGLAALKPNDGKDFFTATSWVGDTDVAYVRVGERSTIWLHDVSERSLKNDRLLAEPTEQVAHLATRRDGRLLWVSSDGEAHVLDPISGEEISTFDLGPVVDIAYDPSGTWLLVCTEDRSLIWYCGGSSGTIPGTCVAAGW